MELMGISTKVLIFVNVIVFVAHLVLNGLAGRGSKLFPNSISDISRMYPLEMTPAGATFSIWGVIYVLQISWIIYSVSTVFRSGAATNILSNEFYVCYMMKLLCTSVWLFVWTRQYLVASLISIGTGQIFICATMYFACRDLHDYLVDNGHSVNADVWCVRMLVQNGILFYGTWTLIATLINVAIVISYTLGNTTLTGSIISLSLLGGIATIWFIVESFAFNSYCEFTFSSYIVLIIGLGGILANSWGRYVNVVGISISLMLLSCIFLIARISIIAVRASRPSMIKA